jgi:hypothetical protein
MPPITAPFTQPAASDGPDDKPITASIAAAATSIDFITISFWIALARPGPSGGHPVAYLNSGSIFSPSLVPPGNSTFLSLNFKVS